MAARIAVVILCSALCGAALLSMRQQRLEAVHDVANAQARVVRLDRELLRVRAQLAAASSPDRVRDMARQLEPTELSPEPAIVPVEPGATQ